MIPKSVVGTLSSDSSNIIGLIENAYNDLKGQVRIRGITNLGLMIVICDCYYYLKVQVRASVVPGNLYLRFSSCYLCKKIVNSALVSLILNVMTSLPR